MASKQREWQIKKAQDGKCITCGRRKIYRNSRCKECREKERVRRSLQWHRRKIEGKCPACGEKWAGKQVLCDECRAIKRASTRQRRED